MRLGLWHKPLGKLCSVYLGAQKTRIAAGCKGYAEPSGRITFVIFLADHWLQCIMAAHLSSLDSVLTALHVKKEINGIFCLSQYWSACMKNTAWISLEPQLLCYLSLAEATEVQNQEAGRDLWKPPGPTSLQRAKFKARSSFRVTAG